VTRVPPLLQLAHDDGDLEGCLALSAATCGSVDIFEVGTVLIAAEGLRAVTKLRETYPNKTLLADLRIMRAGRALAQVAFGSGADWVTVMEEAPDATIAAVVEVAGSYRGHAQVEVSELSVPGDTRRLAGLGVEHVVINRTAEYNGAASGTNLGSRIEGLAEAGLAVTVAGAITERTIQQFAVLPVSVMAVGRSIRNASDAGVAAARVKAAIDRAFE